MIGHCLLANNAQPPFASYGDQLILGHDFAARYGNGGGIWNTEKMVLLFTRKIQERATPLRPRGLIVGVIQNNVIEIKERITPAAGLKLSHYESDKRHYMSSQSEWHGAIQSVGD